MKSKVNRIAVVVVNYHNQDETVACLESFAYLEKGDYSLSFYVVDNGADSKSTTALKQRLPLATVINSPKNLGFGGGSNLGIKRSLQDNADYVLLLNPDTKIESSDFLSQMISCQSDIVSPLIKYFHNNQIIYDYGGRIDYLWGRNTHYTSHKLGALFDHRPDYFTGACLLVKASVFNKVGLFDEGYFLYYEDADFCLRAVRAGLNQTLCSKASIFHLLSTTTSKLGSRKIKILSDSHLHFCRKYLSAFAQPFYLVFNFYLRFKSFYP